MQNLHRNVRDKGAYIFSHATFTPWTAAFVDD